MKKVLITLSVTVLGTLCSCTSHKQLTATPVGETPERPQVVQAPTTPVAPQSSTTRALLDEARSWLGVPYLYGGNDRDGIDCSGFVLQVYLKALSIKLPRTSASQSEWCERISRSELQVGDLVFFDTTAAREGRVSHVGLYIGEGQMIHASSSKGVIVSSIDSNYYSSRFVTGGRVRQYYDRMARH